MFGALAIEERLEIEPQLQGGVPTASASPWVSQLVQDLEYASEKLEYYATEELLLDLRILAGPEASQDFVKIDVTELRAREFRVHIPSPACAYGYYYTGGLRG
eukprot:6729500-Pyramimonas_sp.AAC.1